MLSSASVPCPLIEGRAAIAAAMSAGLVPSACQPLIASCSSGKTTANGVESKTALSPKNSGGSSMNSAGARSGRRWLTYAAVMPPSECPTIGIGPTASSTASASLAKSSIT